MLNEVSRLEKVVMNSQVLHDLKKHSDSIEHKYAQMLSLVSGVASGSINGLIVRGEPGIGKSFTIEQYLLNNFIRNCDNPIRYRHFSGHITPKQTYAVLAEHSDPGNVIMFDDCDGVFENHESLNILKSAVDSKPVRTINWRSSNLDEVTSSVDFYGSIIILTNADFNSIHYKAIRDRMFIYNLQVTDEEKLAKIFSISKNIESLDKKVAFDVVCWLYENREHIKQLTLRTFAKLTQLAKFSSNWQDLARITILNEGVK